MNTCGGYTPETLAVLVDDREALPRRRFGGDDLDGIADRVGAGSVAAVTPAPGSIVVDNTSRNVGRACRYQIRTIGGVTPAVQAGHRG